MMADARLKVPPGRHSDTTRAETWGAMPTTPTALS